MKLGICQISTTNDKIKNIKNAEENKNISQSKC